LGVTKKYDSEISSLPLIYHLTQRVFIISKLSTIKKYILKKLLLISGVLGICFIFSCNKNCKYSDFPDSVKALVNIQKGSFFIYKDSVTGLIDSVYCDRFQISVNSVWCKDANNLSNRFPAITYSFETKSNNAFSFLNIENATKECYKISAILWSNITDSFTIVSSDDILKTRVIYRPNNVTQNITINNIVYPNVQIMKCNGYDFSKYNHTTYYSPTNSLIKITYTDATTGYHAWELQRSNIIKK
jgi:hypothetical protein